ncbi:MAG: Transcription antitermination factor NusG [Mucilaginibacter sp.]|nr:Transcription antitermination factor NusG [Mucilaginibacter sp.]
MENHNILQEKKWLVIYTRPRWEKKVDLLLKQQGIESYCPLRIVESQWADRKKKVSLPLFNSYIFVHVTLKEQSNVLYISGVLGFVYFMGKPAIVRDSVIEQIKVNLTIYNDIEIIDLQTVSVGDKIRIKQGIFTDQLGKIIQIQGKSVLMIFDSINCALVTRVLIQNIAIQNLNQNNESASKQL